MNMCVCAYLLKLKDFITLWMKMNCCNTFYSKELHLPILTRHQGKETWLSSRSRSHIRRWLWNARPTLLRSWGYIGQSVCSTSCSSVWTSRTSYIIRINIVSYIPFYIYIYIIRINLVIVGINVHFLEPYPSFHSISNHRYYAIYTRTTSFPFLLLPRQPPTEGVRPRRSSRPFSFPLRVPQRFSWMKKS